MVCFFSTYVWIQKHLNLDSLRKESFILDDVTQDAVLANVRGVHYSTSPHTLAKSQ
jgi:hypothetical protein